MTHLLIGAALYWWVIRPALGWVAYRYHRLRIRQQHAELGKLKWMSVRYDPQLPPITEREIESFMHILDHYEIPPDDR